MKNKLSRKTTSECLKMRRASLGKTEWIDKKWKGGVLPHPTHQDSSSCWVIFIMMARAVMKAFPAVPVLTFGTSRNEMATERQKMSLQILKASVFDLANNCATCSQAKPPGSGPPLTNWVGAAVAPPLAQLRPLCHQGVANKDPQLCQ